ncbi:hypothetical protein BDZ89DRAFT_1164717 [Hymenopellis radicata]|nr:hypothetical protein BDZ89DRAFT_1164717 [Hymenopellis radicata]
MKTSAAQPQGPMLIGALLGLSLAGVITVQAYVYLTTYQKRDKPWLRLFILFLLALNIGHTGMQFAYLYIALVSHYDDPASLLKVTPVFALTATITGMISLSVQLFFAWRIKIISNGKTWLVALVVVPAFLSLAGSIASAAQAMAVGAFVRLKEPQIKAAVILWLGAAAVADMLIAVILVWHLRKQKTGFSDELVDRIIRSTIQTGLITALCAIADLIIFLTDTRGLHLALNFALGKIYTSTLMSTLNARSHDGTNNEPSAGRVTSGVFSISDVRRSSRYTSGLPVVPEVCTSVEREQEKQAGSSRSDIYDGSTCCSPSSSVPLKESDSVQV